MYSIYADGVCIYSDVFALENMKVVSPKLTLEDSAAGSLTMTLPPQNVGYSTIARLTTDISVQKDGEELWSGRVLQEDKDFWNNRKLYCEGALAFFNDSTQPPAEYGGLSIRAYMEKLIAVHNAKVSENRRFQLGAVTVNDDNFPTRYTNYEKTIELFNALVEQHGGHLRVRFENGARYLDYLKDYPDTCSQLIQFGSNLLEFSRSWDSTEFATAIVPLGSRLKDSPIEALDAYLTVASVNGGSVYIQSDEAVAAYGWIEKTVTWDDVTDPSVLLEKAKSYMTDIQFDNMELELSALDLHYLGVEHEAVKLLDEIRVISRPHGLDRLFPVTKLEIPLDQPEQTRFQLGSTVQTSLTSVNNQINAAIIQKIEGLPKAHSILKEAKENATEIMDLATTGYITITKDQYGSETLYFSNNRDYTKADKLWKWDMNGLGYSKDGGKTYGLAITMDGAIVADYITSGVLNANVIRAGTLRDKDGNFILDMATGKLTMKKGSIDIGNGNFTVDEEGNLYARSGIFAGTLSAAKVFGDLAAYEGSTDPETGLPLDPDSSNTGGWIRGCGISVGGENWRTGQGAFYVDRNGDVTMAGSIVMAGTITWSEGNSPCQVLYARTALSAPSGNFNDFDDYSSSNWHKTFGSYDYYASYTYDGGNSWTTAIKVRGTDGIDGQDGRDGQDGSDASVTRYNIWRAMLNATNTDGLYSDNSGNLLIRASAIKAGVIDAEHVMLSCDNGGFCAATGAGDFGGTEGAAMYGSAGPFGGYYVIATEGGVRMQAGGSSFYVVDGGVTSSEVITEPSDLRMKNSVSYDLERYKDFFLNLKPCSYKFNNGTSGRNHIGYIAQDVESAIEENGISSADFAGFVRAKPSEAFHVKLKDEYRLRYSEFIALNTYMIQSAWKEIEQLKSEVQKLREGCKFQNEENA